MAQLRQNEPEYRKRNVQVVIVGPDNPKAFRRYWRENEMPFPGLADIGNRVADRYGQEVNVLKFGRMPAQFLVDPQGVVRYAHYSDSMSDIPEEDQVMEIIDQAIAQRSA
jgi:peroxiredoxin Q/BCP